MFRVRLIVSIASVAIAAVLAGCSGSSLSIAGLDELPANRLHWRPCSSSPIRLAPTCTPRKVRLARPLVRLPFRRRPRRFHLPRPASCRNRCRSPPVRRRIIRSSRARRRHWPPIRWSSCCNRPARRVDRRRPGRDRTKFLLLPHHRRRIHPGNRRHSRPATAIGYARLPYCLKQPVVLDDQGFIRHNY